jgi:hypothetical protein
MLESNATDRANGIPGRERINNPGDNAAILNANQYAGINKICSIDPWKKMITAMHLQLKILFQREGEGVFEEKMRRKVNSMMMPSPMNEKTMTSVSIKE